MPLSDLNVLVVNIDADSRGRLNEAVRSIIYRVKIQAARDHRDAVEKLTKDGGYSIVIAGATKTNLQVIDLLNIAQAHNPATVPVFVVSLKASDQESGFVAKLYQAGVHGIICEPYTTNDLGTLLALATEQGTGLIEERQKHKRSLEFLAGNAVRQLDKIVTSKVLGKPGLVYDMKTFRTLSTSLSDLLSKVGQATYVEILAQKFNEIEVPSTPRIMRKATVSPKKVVVHPGAIMSQIMAQRKLSVDKLLSIIKIDAAEFDALLTGAGALTEPQSREIARAMGKTAKFWMDAQAEWDRLNKKNQRQASDASSNET